MSIVIERHGTKAAGPVAVVLEHDEPAGNAKRLERGEVLQALVVGDAIVALAGNDKSRRSEVTHIFRRTPLLVE